MKLTIAQKMAMMRKAQTKPSTSAPVKQKSKKQSKCRTCAGAGRKLRTCKK